MVDIFPKVTSDNIHDFKWVGAYKKNLDQNLDMISNSEFSEKYSGGDLHMTNAFYFISIIATF